MIARSALRKNGCTWISSYFERFLETLIIKTPTTTWICVNRWQRQRGDLEDTPYKKATCSNKGHDKDLTLGCRSPCTQPRNRRASSHTSGSPSPAPHPPRAIHGTRNDDGFRAVFINNHLGPGEGLQVWVWGLSVPTTNINSGPYEKKSQTGSL